jgi:membrane protease YdiL (CAAX protease family)
MGPDTLWRDLQGQLFFALLALTGGLLLPGRTLAERLGLGPSELGAGRIGVAVLGFLALSHALHGGVVWLGLLEGGALAEIDRLAREQGPAHPGWVWLALALAPALGEELLFRGFLLRLLALRWRAAPAVLGSAVAFGVAHLELVHGVAAFVLGCYLGALAARAGSLRPAVLSHAANNSLALAGTAGLLPEIGTPGAPAQIGLALALSAGCLALSLWRPRLQPAPPPADEGGLPRGPNEDHSSGSDRR